MTIECVYPEDEVTKAELEELRHELNNLVLRKDNVDKEILNLSRKIDKIILKYYNKV